MSLARIEIIVTSDLEDVVTASYNDLSQPGLYACLAKVTDDFVNILAGDVLANLRVRTLKANSVCRELRTLRLQSAEAFVSLDELHIRWADHYYLMTSVFESPTSLVWTNKVGAPDLAKQLLSLQECRRVTLGDIGAQSGQTALEAIARLRGTGVDVSCVLLGIASQCAIARIGRLAPVEAIFTWERAYWVELKDLLGLDGRLIKAKHGRTSKIATYDAFIRNGPFKEAQKRRLKEVCEAYKNMILDILRSAGLDPKNLPINRQCIT